MPISALPTPPSRSDSPQDFSDRADALLGALPGFVTEANALQSDVNSKEASVSSYATIATNKASEAQASANTASTKAGEAAASAVAAAAAASNAEIAFDSFDDKYLGSKASEPTTDNDGNALLVGALYWNTSVGAVRVWNGAAWLSMAADASIVDFQQAGAGAVVRTAQDKLREAVSLTDFGDVTGVDDTALLQRAIDFIQASTSSELITVGGVSSSYAATLPKLRLPKARLKITSTINCPAYLDVDADGTIIEQATGGADIFVGEAYQWKIKGVIFVGGRHHIHVYNANSDTTMFDFEDNEFHLSSDYAVKTSATGGWSHLSANLKIHGKTRFLKCKKILDNCCDSAEVTGWCYIDKANFAASSAAIRNYAPTSHPRLFLKHFFGVPVMGTPGVDRVANARWIDNYGSVYATGSRFGGEDAGLSILWHYAPQPIAAPYLGYETAFEGCWLFAGPAAANDSGVVVLQGEVPQRISIKNCFGPSDAPFVVNTGSNVSFPAYFTAWESATGRKAYDFFRVDIRNNTADGTDGTVYNERIPAGLRSYVVGAKQARVMRAAAQSVPNGFVNTLASFDTVEADNVGGFSAGNPTRLVMPAGCTKMRITVSGQVAADGAAKILAATLVDSGLSRISGDTSLRGVSADGDRFAFSADVSGVPGTYWHINIQHNAAAALDLLDCRVSLTPLDYVG